MAEQQDTFRRDRDLEQLESYMDVLSDIRRSTVMICDSIRTREKNTLSVLGVQTGSLDGVNISNNDPVRCPVCMANFEDPTIAITICGHGMHKDCMEAYLKKHDDGSGNGRQVFLCPLCRKGFRKHNVLRLIGMHYPTGEAMVWRSIQLCAPWKAEGSAGSRSDRGSASSNTIDSTPEKLYLSLRALFKQTYDLGHIFGCLARLHEDAIQIRSKAVSEKNEITTRISKKEAENNERLSKKESEMNEKWRNTMVELENREAMLLSAELQNESFVGNCLKAVKREETAQLDLLESIVVKQKELDQTKADVIRKQRQVDDAMKELELGKKKHAEAVKKWQDKMKAERQRVASQRNALLLGSQPANENTLESQYGTEHVAPIANDDDAIVIVDDEEGNEGTLGAAVAPVNQRASRSANPPDGRKRYRIE